MLYPSYPFDIRRCSSQEFDCQLQRALNYEDYPEAQTIRQRRQTVDEALAKLQVSLMFAMLHADL